MNIPPAPASVRSDAAPAVLVLDSAEPAAELTSAVRDALPGAAVTAVGDGPAFQAALAKGGWSMVVVSFDLPDPPGPGAVRDARDQLVAAPVLAVGSAPRAEEVVAALRAGAADFFDRSRMEGFRTAATRLLESGGDAGSLAGEPGWPVEPCAIVVFDEHWVVTDGSQGAAQVLGLGGPDAVGQPLEAFFPDGPETLELLARLRTAGASEPVHASGWMLRRDGLQLWAEMTCLADAGADGQVRRYRLAVRDATLQYRASRSLRFQADAAAAATASRNQFLGSIAHELRASLDPIATSAILLERQAAEPARHAQLLAIIRRNAAAALRMLEDLQMFSTASAHKLSLRLAPVDLGRLVTECTYALQEQAIAARVDLRVEVSAMQSGGVLRCDPLRIQQVVTNLLANAIKFTPPRGTVWVRTGCTEDGCHVEVADTGVGIDPAVLPFIFEPFEQGGAEVTSRYGGFGLGLAVCAAIARQHGGRIIASSAGPGQGASFRLDLPKEEARALPAQPAPREPAVLHVLYVEDNPDAADAMRYALATLGWTMTHAATCAQARQLVREAGEPFDVMLADLGLPDGSGLELGSELCRHLPVVALTAYGAPLAMEGFASQLIKPAEISEVQRALMKAVTAHRSEVGLF